MKLVGTIADPAFNEGFKGAAIVAPGVAYAPVASAFTYGCGIRVIAVCGKIHSCMLFGCML